MQLAYLVWIWIKYEKLKWSCYAFNNLGNRKYWRLLTLSLVSKSWGEVELIPYDATMQLKWFNILFSVENCYITHSPVNFAGTERSVVQGFVRTNIHPKYWKLITNSAHSTPVDSRRCWNENQFAITVKWKWVCEMEERWSAHGKEKW